MPTFDRYIGIDYSGAETPTSSLKGLRVYSASLAAPPHEVQPPPGPRKYWTRRGIAEWLLSELNGAGTAIVGIDHGFSFPLRYFEAHGLPLDWEAFLEDFHGHWPTDNDNMYVDFIRDGIHGNGLTRLGNARWRRITEERARAKSVFHFDVQGSVAKSTHAGIPWLRYLKIALGEKVFFWPFEGWEPPTGRSVVVEVYPALWSRQFPQMDRDGHQHDAYSIAGWMRQSDLNGSLAKWFTPTLSAAERTAAEIEGWIFGAA